MTTAPILASFLVASLMLSGCATKHQPAAAVPGSAQPQSSRGDCLPEVGTESGGVQRGAAAGGPPPAPVPPNGSRVVAQVMKHAIWAPGTLGAARPPVHPEQVLFSLTLSIVSSGEQDAGRQNLAVPGTTVEAFSCSPLSPELNGKNIEGVLNLTGDTRGTRWWISNIRVVP